jgi:hypothetical protein
VSLAALAIAGAVLGGSAARAEEGSTILICKESLAQPVAAAGCATVGVIVNELFAERPFGPNGEIMKVLAAPVKIVDGNIKAAARESGEGAKVLRATTGISVDAINENGGVFGGGLSGGENSFFRKNLGIHF